MWAEQLCKCTKKHWLEHFKKVNFMVCKLYLYKAVENDRKGKPAFNFSSILIWVLYIEEHNILWKKEHRWVG